ncbi:Uncharacterized protein APZ42_027460 [Daphnia magna]|uniref:Uncharacterized protein n=1 Tax=Daphnia magna TaxID=35525 RepID=A0A0P6CXV1_9CRUS|nr:Uncharacterized protein APZ42_027460 [Daphnia magna]
MPCLVERKANSWHDARNIFCLASIIGNSFLYRLCTIPHLLQKETTWSLIGLFPRLVSSGLSAVVYVSNWIP